jgi:hypothetical protein
MKFSMKVEVKSANVQEKRGMSRQGKPYCIREQEGWAHSGQAYPVRMVLSLADEQEAYRPGFYEVDETAIYIGKYGSLEFGRLKLKPVARAAA